MCIDFRRLNTVTDVEVYPMPRVDELLNDLAKESLFPHWTLRRVIGRWQWLLRIATRQPRQRFLLQEGFFSLG